jgi:GTP-binding protein Era
MVDVALEAMEHVDLLGLVVDASEALGKGNRYVVDLVTQPKTPVFLILNKIDLMKKPKLLPIIDAYAKLASFAEIVPVSAATGDNVDRLERAIIDRLPEGERMYPDDYLTDQPERFLAGEIVREKLLQLTSMEIPFSSAVLVDRFEEPRGGDAGHALLRLHCSILVERDSQRAIVVGKGGDLVKRIGIAAREELERFFGVRVFLDLHVKVKADWREDARVLGALGN